MDPQIIATGVGAWIWQTYGKFIADKAVGAAKIQWEHFNWRQASEKYRRRVKELYGTMHIFGMSEPAPLEEIYSDVFVLDKPTAFRHYDIEQIIKQLKASKPSERKRLIKEIDRRHDKEAEEDAFEQSPNRQNALHIVAEKSRLFILGKPGAGKTTLLKYVALQAAEGRLDKVPVFVSLKEWANSGSAMMAFIVRQFEICAFPEAQPFIVRILQDGKAILLFDGLAVCRRG